MKLHCFVSMLSAFSFCNKAMWFSGLHLVVLFFLLFCAQFSYFIPFKEKAKKTDTATPPPQTKKQKCRKKDTQIQLAQLWSQIVSLMFWGVGYKMASFAENPIQIVVSAYFVSCAVCAHEWRYRVTCASTNIGGSSVRADQESASGRLARSLDPHCALALFSKATQVMSCEEVEQKISLYSKGRDKRTDSSNMRDRALFQAASSQVWQPSTCRPSSAVFSTTCRMG